MGVESHSYPGRAGRRVLQAKGTTWAKALRLEGGRARGMRKAVEGEEMSQGQPGVLW